MTHRDPVTLRPQLAAAVIVELARVTETSQESIDENTLLDDIGLDSLGTIEVLVGVYDTFLDVDDADDRTLDEVPQLRTAGELVDFVLALAVGDDPRPSP